MIHQKLRLTLCSNKTKNVEPKSTSPSAAPTQKNSTRSKIYHKNGKTKLKPSSKNTGNTGKQPSVPSVKAKGEL